MSWQDTKRRLDARRRLKQFSDLTVAQLESVSATLEDISEIFGLETFTIVATMQDGSERRANLYAETWQAAGRQAETLFIGAESIVITPRKG